MSKHEEKLEGQSTRRPPLFNGTNYFRWKTGMIDFLKSFDFQVWLVVKNGPAKIV